MKLFFNNSLHNIMSKNDNEKEEQEEQTIITPITEEELWYKIQKDEKEDYEKEY